MVDNVMLVYVPSYLSKYPSSLSPNGLLYHNLTAHYTEIYRFYITYISHYKFCAYGNTFMYKRLKYSSTSTERERSTVEILFVNEKVAPSIGSYFTYI